MKKETIGTNAGIVWNTLNTQYGKLTLEELYRLSGLNPIDLAAAIGWLAREDKVEFFQEEGINYIALYNERYY